MKTKLGIVGCGFLGNIVADAWKKGLLPDYELVGVTSRTRASAEKTAANVGCAVCEDVDALLALEPEYIVEAASVESVRAMAIPSRQLPWRAVPRCTWPAVPSAALTCCRRSP